MNSENGIRIMSNDTIRGIKLPDNCTIIEIISEEEKRNRYKRQWYETEYKPLMLALTNDVLPDEQELSDDEKLFDNYGLGYFNLDEDDPCVTKFINLDLQCCSINDNEAIELPEALRANPSLRRLVLSFNKVGDKGAIALAEALKVNTHLYTLSLYDNEIGDKGVIALAEALKVNSTLEYIDLRSNNITFTDVCVLTLIEAMKINTSLEELLINKGLKFAIALHCPEHTDHRLHFHR